MLNLGKNHDFLGFQAIKEVISDLETQKFFGLVGSEIWNLSYFEIFGCQENRDFSLNWAPIYGLQRVQGWRIFNFLGSLDPKSKICQILKFLGVKVAYDLIYGPKTMKIVILP